MSALTPNNGKYRRSWLTWGKQMVPSEKYKEGYDNIKWGEDTGRKKIEQKSEGHYVIKFERD